MRTNKFFYLLSFITGLAAFTCSGNESETGINVPFEVIHKGEYSSFAEKKYIVIKSQDELNKFLDVVYQNLDQRPNYPEVDFDKYTCAGLMMGNKNTGGYDIRTDKLIEKSKTVTITVNEISPGKDCITTRAISSPYEVIKFSKTNKDIKFKTNSIYEDCK